MKTYKERNFKSIKEALSFVLKNHDCMIEVLVNECGVDRGYLLYDLQYSAIESKDMGFYTKYCVNKKRVEYELQNAWDLAHEL